MKKIISTLLITAMFSTATFAQTTKTVADKKSELKNSSNLTQKNFVDDFEDDDSIGNSKITSTKQILKPANSYDAKKYAEKPEVPSNIKQDFKEEPDDGYFLEGFQLGVGIGVLGGANAHLGYRIPRRDYNFWKNRFGFRIDYNSWKPLKSRIEKYLKDNPIEVDDNDFSGMISGTNYGALIDFYPFGNTWFLGNFRISGGYYTGDFAVNAWMTKNGGGEFEMNDIKYKVENATATLRAGIEADVKGPYAGIGFDFQILYGLKLYFDAGVVFIDNPRITTDITGEADLYVKYPDNYSITDAELEEYKEKAKSMGVDLNKILPAGINLNGKKDSDGYTYAGKVDAENNETVKKLLEDTKNEYSDKLDVITDSKIFPMVKIGLMLRF